MPRLVCAGLFIVLALPGTAAAKEVGRGPVENAEAIYAEVRDASSVIGAIDSGLFSEYRGKDRAAWEKQFRARRDQFRAAVGALSASTLSPGEARVLAILQAKLDTFSDEDASPASSAARCADAQQKTLTFDALSAALDACFTEIGSSLEFEGERIDRASALGRLSQIAEPARRKALFMAFAPLWTAVNGSNDRDSPYRRLLRLAKGSAIDAAGRTLGVTSAQVEQWLTQILEAWSAATRDEGQTEPWDFRYASGAADRALGGKIPLASMLQIDHRFYHDLGADLDALGVLYDVEPREGKGSVAYTDFLLHGHRTSQGWQPTIARVFATYRDGSLGSLNELVHENGHAVHISAIRNRPVYVDWNDDLFVEAFADVSSWSLYEPAWQRHYLGAEASERESLRALFGGVILDVAWSLFECRMLRDPTTDPNALWTQITQKYLHIVPHPEISWWAVRGQLVGGPGYMVNYGLGAVLTADLREAVRERIGTFDTGNPRWYPWLSEHLLRYGSEVDTPQLLQKFLGRAVSPDALLAQIRRMRGT